MKRFLVICLAVLITLLVGCNDAKPSNTKKPTTDNSEIQISSDDKPGASPSAVCFEAIVPPVPIISICFI